MIAKDRTERTVCRCLVHRPHYSARLIRFGSRGPSEFFSQIRHRNALTEIAWEDVEQGLGMAISTLASEKNMELLFIGNVFYKQWHLEGTTSLKSQILIPARSQIFAMEKISSRRERRKWSLHVGLAHN